MTETAKKLFDVFRRRSQSEPREDELRPVSSHNERRHLGRGDGSNTPSSRRRHEHRDDELRPDSSHHDRHPSATRESSRHGRHLSATRDSSRHGRHHSSPRDSSHHERHHSSTRDGSHTSTSRHRSERGDKVSTPPKKPSQPKPRAPVVTTLAAISPKWPPEGFSAKEELPLQKAKALITPGVPVFRGFRFPIPHASDDFYALYAACEGPQENEGDGAGFYKAAFAACTFQLQGPGVIGRPWDTLEQPSMAFCYGNRPGTITLNHWASLSGRLKPTIELIDSGMKPRDISLSAIFDRLIYLQQDGFEQDDEDIMYNSLYKLLLKDPGGLLSPHKAMEKQIADLIVVLTGPQFIDFSDPRNQIVAKFFHDRKSRQYKDFFHQLLLSIELDTRIHSKDHAEVPKQKLLAQLPPCISWSLALARKWCDCMVIEKRKDRSGDTSTVKFRLKAKKHQVRALRKFAIKMKWPALAEVEKVLESKDTESIPLEDRSSDAMSYFTGLVLPGPTLPWLLMNSLIDCDKDSSALVSLTHMFSHTGFQYRSSTYWASTCIVGKVLAPTCQEIAGWIGPATSSRDLDRIQIARIRQRRPRMKVSTELISSMAVRSEPLGSPATSYLIDEYQLVLPDLEDVPNTVRIEKLALKAVPQEPPSANRPIPSPPIFDACVIFAINGQSWPLRLAFDVSFICACPCLGGPHPLFYDYIYKAIKVDEVLSIRDWGRANGGKGSTLGTDSDSDPDPRKEENDVERVLIVEAFGVPDNEVMARAYCSHWGLSAIIANVRKTCMACAIREAYAACINVVILVQDLQYDPEA